MINSVWYLAYRLLKTYTIAAISPAVQDAFISFISDGMLLALPLSLENNTIRAQTPIRLKDVKASFQNYLNLLDGVLEPKTPLYVLLRRHNAVSAITFVPYRAREDHREQYLYYRKELVNLLGDHHFEKTFICKEVGEITDARSWDERDQPQNGEQQAGQPYTCGLSHEENKVLKDAGYKKNICRLCDRRMKNKITDEALEALQTLQTPQKCVQIVHAPRLCILVSSTNNSQSLNADLVLALDLRTSSLSPELVMSHLPTTRPTFTFYHHPNTLIYFIFHSPDSATVQQRMKHTMAIPGLVNVHAQDCGVHVAQKIEIHEPSELVFEERDERLGKFRSMYLRGEWQGTESQYEALDKDKQFYDAVR